MCLLYFVLFFFPLSLSALPADCQVYFTHKDQISQKLVQLIDREPKNIKMAIYTLTHKTIVDALIRAKERGVAIEVIVDPNSIKARASAHRLAKAKVPLFIWDYELRADLRESVKPKRTNKPLMHDKFCIFGDHLVWTGSFNFTHDAASKHQENVVTLESREIAAQYHTQFAEMKLYETRPYEEYLGVHPPKRKKT